MFQSIMRVIKLIVFVVEELDKIRPQIDEVIQDVKDIEQRIWLLEQRIAHPGGGEIPAKPE